MARYTIKELEPSIDALDLVLLAYIFREAAPFWGRTKLQKTIFLSELDLREHGLVGPHFNFYRWRNGPFSKELWEAYDILRRRGFVSKNAEPKLTRRGYELSQLVDELKKTPENRNFFQVLDATLEYCRIRNGQQLLEAVYEMWVRPEHSQTKIKIFEMPLKLQILEPPTISSLQIEHDLKKLILEELEISEEDVEKARRDELPAMEREFVRRLMSGDPRSS